MKVLSKIREINLKKVGICSCLIGIINMIVHLFVISEIIPYTWVNGGRTTSLIAAKELSAFSISITIINILIALIASSIIPVKFNKFWGILLSTFLISTLPFGLIGIVQQFLGTTFEKTIMSLVTIMGFLSDTRIAFEKRW